jgi:hemolysin D
MIRVLLVDDQKSVRERLKSILAAAADFDIVGMAENGFEAIELVQQLQPDVVLMDMEMPDIDGTLATKIIAQGALHQQVKVLVISSYDDREYVDKSMQAGAQGYLLKGTSAEGIRGAVRSIYQGQAPIDPDLLAPIVTAAATSTAPPAPPTLSETGSSGLELTDSEIEEPVSGATAPDFDEFHASQMLVDVVPITVQYRSRRWQKLSAIIIVALGLTGGLYGLYQHLRPSFALVLPTSKAKPDQVFPIQAPQSGLVHDIKVKIGQQVLMGESLMVIRDTAAEKIHQSHQQHAAAQQQIVQKQQQLIEQQQKSSQQRMANLQQQVNSDKQNIALLRSKIASSNSPDPRQQRITNQSALVQQQQELVRKAQAVYQRQNSVYRRKQQLLDSQQRISETKGATSEGFEQFITGAESARVEMEYARSNYENAQLALQEANQAPADIASVAFPSPNIQQQLEQEVKLRKLQEQLLQEQLSYKQLATNWQSLQQQKNPAAEPQIIASATLQPVLVDVVASKSGYVVKLLVRDGDQISTGSKLMEIANNQ